MRRRRLHLLPHLRQQDMHLLLRPPIPITQQPHREGLQPVQQLDQIAGTHLFKDRVLWPRPDRELDLFDDYVLEPRCFDPFFEAASGISSASDAVGHFEEFVAPDFGGVVGFQGAVLGVEGEVVVLEFGPAAGTEVAGTLCQQPCMLGPSGWQGLELAKVDPLVDVFDQLGPVGNASDHVAAEDKVKGRGMRPGAFDIVDFEFDVGGNPTSLLSSGERNRWNLCLSHHCG